MNTEKFKLFSDCILVKGATRGMICDIQRGGMKFVPNSLIDIFEKHDGDSKEFVINNYPYEMRDTINEYYEYLVKNEFGFFTKSPELFSPIDKLWDTPSTITNGIVDVNEKSNHDFKKIFKQYSNLGCQYLQIRFYSTTSIKYLEKSLSSLKSTRINAIELFIKNNEDLSLDKLMKLKKRNPRIYRIYVHSVKENVGQNNIKDIFFSNEIIDSNVHCGVISPDYFILNREMYLESKNFNSCLNRKISIDTNGDIKNCPSLKLSYGNIKNMSLKKALKVNGFSDLWSLKKDDIDVCKDCEFRYICTDCRAFVGKKDKPKKCGYNPYTAKWN